MGGGTTMGNAKHIGRVGALAVALGVGNVRRAAARMTVSIGAAVVVVMATAVPAPDSTVSPAVKLAADSTALLMGGTSIPTWNDADVEVLMGQFIAHIYPFDVSLAPDASTSPAFQGTHGDTSYYFFETTGPAVVRSAAHVGGARVVDRCGRAVLPGDRGTGL
jgi:hypothetical protein